VDIEDEMEAFFLYILLNNLQIYANDNASFRNFWIKCGDWKTLHIALFTFNHDLGSVYSSLLLSADDLIAGS
jgi:hypothetical protein